MFLLCRSCLFVLLILYFCGKGPSGAVDNRLQPEKNMKRILIPLLALAAAMTFAQPPRPLPPGYPDRSGNIDLERGPEPRRQVTARCPSIGGSATRSRANISPGSSTCWHGNGSAACRSTIATPIRAASPTAGHFVRSPTFSLRRGGSFSGGS